jgi:hypothetical protein
MNEKIQKRIKQINMENNIWIIYLFIIILSYYANYKEKDFFLNNNQESKEIYRKINAFIFSILIIVYSYFEIDALNSLKEGQKRIRNNNYDILSFIATTAVLISGIIFLYIIINDRDLEEEIAFN